jgi:hypothetical protein
MTLYVLRQLDLPNSDEQYHFDMQRISDAFYYHLVL